MILHLIRTGQMKETRRDKQMIGHGQHNYKSNTKLFQYKLYLSSLIPWNTRP